MSEPSCGAPGAELSGSVRHIAHDSTEWLAVCSLPDYCKVGNAIVGFDTTATLDQPVKASPDVEARGTPVYRQDDLFKEVQGDAGSHIVAGTSLGSGHVRLLDGHDGMLINGLPPACHDSRVLINCNASGVGGALGRVITRQESVTSSPSPVAEPGERPMHRRMGDEAGKVLEDKWQGIEDSATTLWEALPFTADDATTAAARQRIKDGAMGTLEGLATLAGPSPEELYAGVFNPELAAINEARQQAQQEAIGGIVDATKRAWNEAEERSGTAGATAMVLTTLGVELVGGKGAGTLAKTGGRIADIVKTSKTPEQAAVRLDAEIAKARKAGADNDEIELLEKARDERLEQARKEKAANDAGDGVEVEPEKMGSHAKAALGERTAHAKMEELGYERIDTGGDYVPGRTGIDGVYRNTKPPHEYVIMESKYGKAELGETLDGRQMSDDWIRARLEKAVGDDMAKAIERALNRGEVKRVLIRTKEDGSVTGKLLGADGKVILGNKGIFFK
ncbi:hypothetical protein FQZ97_457890 [compost metagenome]